MTKRIKQLYTPKWLGRVFVLLNVIIILQPQYYHKKIRKEYFQFVYSTTLIFNAYILYDTQWMILILTKILLIIICINNNNK